MAAAVTVTVTSRAEAAIGAAAAARLVWAVARMVVTLADRMVEAGHYKELESILLRLERSGAADDDDELDAPPAGCT